MLLDPSVQLHLTAPVLARKGDEGPAATPRTQLIGK